MKKGLGTQVDIATASFEKKKHTHASSRSMLMTSCFDYHHSSSHSIHFSRISTFSKLIFPFPLALFDVKFTRNATFEAL